MKHSRKNYEVFCALYIQYHAYVHEVLCFIGVGFFYGSPDPGQFTGTVTTSQSVG